MDVNVNGFELCSVDPIFLGVNTGIRERQLRTFLHHIAQAAGQFDLTASLFDHLNFNGKRLAAHTGPCKAVGNANHLGAIQEFRLHTARAKQIFQSLG